MAINLKDQNDDERVEIRLNRKMRTWNKYKKYVIGGGAVLVIVIALILILRGCSDDNDKNQQETNAQNQPTTQAVSQQETTQVPSQQETTTQQPTTQASAQTGSSLKVDGTAVDQDFIGRDQFAGVTFIGDAIVSGFSYYGYIDDANVISDGNLTSDGADEYIGSIAATNPSKVVLMVGLNDLNYGTRGADTIAEYIGTFVDDMKSAVPTANIYVLSVLPVTSSFEASGNVSITQSGIDELNTKLSEQAADKKYTYVDVASSYKDGTGYMGSSYTGNGTNIYNEYYPFLLNGLAGVMK